MSICQRSESSRHCIRSRGRPVDLSKREAIVEAASKSFFDIGYTATSIEQIAADANVSKVTIYNQFGDKRTLFAEAVAYECARMRDLLVIGGELKGSLRERLTFIAQALSDFLSRPEMVRFDRRVATEAEHDPEIGRAFLNAGPYRMKAAFGARLQSMVDAGELVIEDYGLATEQFVSMCKGMGDMERRFGLPRDLDADQARIAGAVDAFLKIYTPD